MRARWIGLAMLLVLGAGALLRPWSDEVARLTAADRAPRLPPSAETPACPALGAEGRFDWAAIGSDAALAACLLAAAHRLGPPEAMADWLAAAGFAVTPPYPQHSEAPDSPVLLGAFWLASRRGAHWPYGGALHRAASRALTFAGRLTGLSVPDAYRVTILYAQGSATTAAAGKDWR